MYTVYGNASCGWCRKAVKLLEDYGRQYAYRDVDDLEILNELKTRLPTARTIPQVWWDDQHIGGYEDLATHMQNTLGGYGEGKL
jgi:glutaredoxin 3